MGPRRSSRVAQTIASQTSAPPAPAQGGTKKRRVNNKKAAPSTQKYGLSGSAAPENGGALGRVDPASGLAGQIYTDATGAVYDAMLNLVDITNNSDKYYILQVVEHPGAGFTVYTRWGRTGTSGACKKEACNTADKAVAQFCKMFEQKTGVAWEGRSSYTPQPGKYVWTQADPAQDAKLWQDKAKWQYWVDDGVDGKCDGWYDYSVEGSDVVEQLFHDWTFNTCMHQRIVTSGAWEYLVDLACMTQTNVLHPNRTTRHIRRWTQALGVDQTPPGELCGVCEGDQQKTANTLSVPSQPSASKGKSRKRPGPSVPATASTAAASPAKKVKVKEEDAKKCHSVDPACNLLNAHVHQGFSVMLNQTNVGANNNKFYRIQLLTDDKSSKFYVWTHWGRVGEDGSTQLQGAFDEVEAIKTFESKFKSKTGNSWEDRANFAPKSGKYDLVEVEQESDDQAQAWALAGKVKAESKVYPPSKLDGKTQALVELMFDDTMFEDAMAAFDIDVKKMPLGNLSQAQVKKGYDVLLELRDAIKKNDTAEITRLTGRFYTVIPHTFGRQRPPLIETDDKLRAKFEMCDVLADIESAQELLKEAEGSQNSQKLDKHPVDSKYESLGTKLTLLDSKCKEFEMIETYVKNTGAGNATLKDVWTVESGSLAAKFKPFTKLDNHMLLWHGTNVAVVAAILSGGLRIMPHSGGRVGKGIYMASEHAKSSWYVRPGSQRGESVGVMFLVQAALGKSHVIMQDDCRITEPPKGFDSVVARGRQEPDPAKKSKMKLDGKNVIVPQGAPVKQPQAANSSFANSEYLVYNEGQHRLRYVLTFKW